MPISRIKHSDACLLERASALGRICPIETSSSLVRQSFQGTCRDAAAAVFYSGRCRPSPTPPFPGESRAPELKGAAVGENRALGHSAPGEAELGMSYWGGSGSRGGSNGVVGYRGRLASSAGWRHDL
jgi:hypothetical protein